MRHTPTYTPPVASRTFGYLGVTAFEATVGGSKARTSLVGQLQGLDTLPQRAEVEPYDEAIVLNAAMATAVRSFFENTGPTGQHVLEVAEKQWRKLVVAGKPADVVSRSESFGRSIGAAVHSWSLGDGGARIENLGFPAKFDLVKGEGKWVPTSLISQQQVPLLPTWGSNRPLAMPEGSSCPVPPPVAYSEDENSEFFRDAREVYETVKSITPEQRAIARFWSDDPMLSVTPPGHWISIALQISERDKLSLDDSVDVLTRLGIAVADAFIGCWHEKYEFNLVRPITYIRSHIDPKWDAILITPPFPEYPSGHSTASAASAAVLTSFFGESFAFEDTTGARDQLSPRSFPSFWAAAEEAGISRLYGGIHFRPAIERGLAQGRCIAAYAIALRTRS